MADGYIRGQTASELVGFPGSIKCVDRSCYIGDALIGFFDIVILGPLNGANIKKLFAAIEAGGGWG
jgi:hypothetical protein